MEATHVRNKTKEKVAVERIGFDVLVKKMNGETIKLYTKEEMGKFYKRYTSICAKR